MDKRIIINMFSGPGAGKSTTAAALFTLLKLHQGIQCELVSEFAKDLVWEKRKHTLKNQHYVFSKQQHRLWRVSQMVDITITDSPILLSCIYGQDLTTEKFKEYVLEEFKKYNNLNFFIERTKRYIENGRNQTEAEAMEIDDTIKGYLSKHNIYYHTIEGNISGISDTMNIVLRQIGRELEYEIVKK